MTEPDGRFVYSFCRSAATGIALSSYQLSLLRTSPFLMYVIRVFEYVAALVVRCPRGSLFSSHPVGFWLAWRGCVVFWRGGMCVVMKMKGMVIVVMKKGMLIVMKMKESRPPSPPSPPRASSTASRASSTRSHSTSPSTTARAWIARTRCSPRTPPRWCAARPASSCPCRTSHQSPHHSASTSPASCSTRPCSPSCGASCRVLASSTSTAVVAGWSDLTYSFGDLGRLLLLRLLRRCAHARRARGITHSGLLVQRGGGLPGGARTHSLQRRVERTGAHDRLPHGRLLRGV